MTATQSLILDRIEENVTSHGLIVAIDFAYANTGTIRSLTEKLNLVSELVFDFQSHRIEFKPGGRSEPVASYWYGEVRKPGQAAYVKSSIPELINAVCDWLNG